MSHHVELYVLRYIMWRSHIVWQWTLLLITYTSGVQQPWQWYLLSYGTTLISLSPTANGIIVDVCYQCFCQIYVKYPATCKHFDIMIQSATRGVSLHVHIYIWNSLISLETDTMVYFRFLLTQATRQWVITTNTLEQIDISDPKC